MQTRRRGRGAPVMCPVHGSKAVAITKSTLRATQRFKSSEGSTEGVRNPTAFTSTASGGQPQAGGTREVLDPADATTLAVVAEGGLAGHRRGGRRRPPRLRRRASGPVRPSPSGPPCCAASPTCSQRDREEIGLIETRDAGKTLEEGRVDVDDVTARLPLLRRPRRGRVRAAGSSTPATADVHSVVVHEPVGVCAHDHALELPAAPGELEDRPGAGRGQHLRAQAQRDHSADHRRT